MRFQYADLANPDSGVLDKAAVYVMAAERPTNVIYVGPALWFRRARGV